MTLAPISDEYDAERQVQATYFRLPKVRTGGIPLVAKVYFSFKQQSYSFQYRLGLLSARGDKWTELAQDKLPDWAAPITSSDWPG
jgi:hypothetical protein